MNASQEPLRYLPERCQASESAPARTGAAIGERDGPAIT